MFLCSSLWDWGVFLFYSTPGRLGEEVTVCENGSFWEGRGTSFLVLWVFFLHLSVAVSGSYFFADGRVSFGWAWLGGVVLWDGGWGDGGIRIIYECIIVAAFGGDGWVVWFARKQERRETRVLGYFRQ